MPFMGLGGKKADIISADRERIACLEREIRKTKELLAEEKRGFDEKLRDRKKIYENNLETISRRTQKLLQEAEYPKDLILENEKNQTKKQKDRFDELNRNDTVEYNNKTRSLNSKIAELERELSVLTGCKEEPADKPASKPADKPVSKPADKPVSKPADRPVSKPADEPASKPADEPASKPKVKMPFPPNATQVSDSDEVNNKQEPPEDNTKEPERIRTIIGNLNDSESKIKEELKSYVSDEDNCGDIIFINLRNNDPDYIENAAELYSMDNMNRINLVSPDRLDDGLTEACGCLRDDKSAEKTYIVFSAPELFESYCGYEEDEIKSISAKISELCELVSKQGHLSVYTTTENNIILSQIKKEN